MHSTSLGAVGDLGVWWKGNQARIQETGEAIAMISCHGTLFSLWVPPLSESQHSETAIGASILTTSRVSYFGEL